jgi:hypothetical protein
VIEPVPVQVPGSAVSGVPTVGLLGEIDGAVLLVGPAAEISGVTAELRVYAYQLPRPGAEATLVVPEVAPVVVFAP